MAIADGSRIVKDVASFREAITEREEEQRGGLNATYLNMVESVARGNAIDVSDYDFDSFERTRDEIIADVEHVKRRLALLDRIPELRKRWSGLAKAKEAKAKAIQKRDAEIAKVRAKHATKIDDAEQAIRDADGARSTIAELQRHLDTGNVSCRHPDLQREPLLEELRSLEAALYRTDEDKRKGPVSTTGYEWTDDEIARRQELQALIDEVRQRLERLTQQRKASIL